MRRVVPWSLLLVLSAGVVASATLGAQNQPALSARARIAAIIAATTGAPSVRFTDSSVTKSSNALLRSRGSGSGEVDFATDSMRESDRQRSTEWVGSGGAPSHPVRQATLTNEIQIGRTDYIRFSLDTQVRGTRWIKGATFPRGSVGPFGALGEISPLDSLAMNESVKGLRVQDLGAATIDGHAATKLQVSLPKCQAVTHGRGIRTVIAPTELWVDGQDRLLQATATTDEDTSKDAFTGPGYGSNIPTGRMISTQTVRLYDFGAPVSITAPRVTPAGSSSSSGFIELRRRGCSS